VAFEIPKDIREASDGKSYIKNSPLYHHPRPAEELYDLAKDPHEFTNLAENPKYESVKKSLESRLMKFLRDTQDPVLSENPPQAPPHPKFFIY
jgi:hypothetical protein